MIVGLTGVSGAGKSTVAALFAKRGFRIIDCDEIVHALYKEKRYARKIAETFGEQYLSGGAVDRKRLGALVFSDPSALALLNETVHPMILSAVVREIERSRSKGENAVLDAPLLFEYGLENMCDTTVGVITDIETAVRRLAGRDGKSEEELRGRLASQHSADYFAAHCDNLLRNDSDSAALIERFHALLRDLKLPTD